MAIEAVKIPQNVYVEDHIIGPVTLKQLMITGLGCGISYVLYAMATKAGHGTIPVVVACSIPALIAASFSFVKINDLSLFNIILLIIESTNKPSQRYWSPHGGITINLITRQFTKEIYDANAKIADNSAKLADITRQLQKRQEEMNKLTLHDNPNPSALEPVKTLLQQRLAVGGITAEEVPVREAMTSEASTLPVNKEKVRAQGLDKSRSIDTLAEDIQAYEKMFAATA